MLRAVQHSCGSLRRRPGTHLGLKLWALPLALAITWAYRSLQVLTADRAWPVPRLPFEDQIPFRPQDVGIYLSMFGLLFLPWLDNDPGRLRRYMAGVALATALACGIFWLWPTCVVRPEAPQAPWPWRLMVAWDPPANACPSLHAAWALLAVLSLGSWMPRPARPLLGVWLGAILVSTLTTRQHVLLDLLGGLGLGVLVHRLTFEARAGQGRPPLSGAGDDRACRSPGLSATAEPQAGEAR
jgi:membrane-associated phospholipid phosphatase